MADLYKRLLKWSGVGDEHGATAAELALVLIPLIMLTIGTINLGMILYTMSTLHFAVENTARWTAIQTSLGTAPSSTAVQAHGVGVYKGPGLAVTFTPWTNTTRCSAQLITGTANYNFSTGITNTVLPLSATACYPLA